MKKYLFIGDSVTEAGRDINNPNDLGHGFVLYLSKMFPKDEFINRGISGQKVSDLLKRYQQDIINLEPDICFIWVGVNDAWLPYLLKEESTLNTFYQDYDTLINKILSESPLVEIVLIKAYAVIKSGLELMIEDLKTIRIDVERLGLKYKINVLDIKSFFQKKMIEEPNKTLFYDGIHPTLMGYQSIAKYLSEYIKGSKL